MHAAPLGVAALEDVAPLLGRRFLLIQAAYGTFAGASEREYVGPSY